MAAINGTLETIEPSEKSKLWIDAIRMFDYEKYVLQLPEPALLNTLKYLRLPDLITLKCTCPELSELVDVQIRHMDEEFSCRPFFQFERCAPPEDVDEDNHIEQMSERQNASVTYFPGDRCVYLFGGETLDRVDDGPRACFNDLWKLDTGTMKWSRVVICTAPYPSPKCQASFVTWRDQLILYGGRAYHHDGRDLLYSELHFFDVRTSKWRRHTPSGPFQRPMAGHSAVLSRNFMIMYGGFSAGHGPQRNGCLTVMDLRNLEFHYIEMSRVENEGEEVGEQQQQRWIGEEEDEEEMFPILNVRMSKLVQIREGVLLLTGEMHVNDYGSSVLIDFNPDDELVDQNYPSWKWRRITTSGRWWRGRTPPNQGRVRRNQFPWQVGRQDPEINDSRPNFEFWQIADVRNSETIRLVSLGRLSNEREVPRVESSDKYDAVQLHYREFVRHLQRHLESEFQQRLNPSEPSSPVNDKKTCAVFKFLNMHCKIENCFHNGTAKTKPIKVRIRIGLRKNAKVPKLDDADRWELRSTIRATVNQLHSKYYDTAQMQHLVARVPNRNSLVRRLSIYVAEIPIDVDLEEFQELVWTPQPMQFPSPPETHHYSLIGAHHDVIMHGGVVKYNQSMHRMGHTTLLTPISSIASHPKPIFGAY